MPLLRHGPAERQENELVEREIMMEETLVLVKGDGVQRRLIGEIIRRIEAKNLDVKAMQLMDVSRELAEEHYSEHRDKPFFEELVEFITTTPVVAMRISGEGAIKVMRKLMGATNPAEAEPGTIRGDLALSMPDNLVHGSDSPESAERELRLFFGS